MKKSRTCFCILLCSPLCPWNSRLGQRGRAPGIDRNRRTGRKQRGDHGERLGQVEFVTHPPNRLTARWYLLGPGPDPPPAGYALSSQSFVLPAGGYTAIAVAPTEPNAPSSGTIPQPVFEDLVIALARSSEGEFVAASMLSQTG
jgi:hypothetical protein